MLSHIGEYEKYRPVYAEYIAIGWKRKKENFAEEHREELDAFQAAVRYFKANLKDKNYRTKELEDERKHLAAALTVQRKELEEVQADVKILRDVRGWLNQILPPEQRRATADPGKKASVTQTLKWKTEAARQREAQKQQELLKQPQKQKPKKQKDMEL